MKNLAKIFCFVVLAASPALAQIDGIGPVGNIVKLHDGFQLPFGLTTDAQGNAYFSDFYFTDSLECNIYKVDTAGQVSPFLKLCGGPGGLAFDNRGHLILCQTYYKRVISIDVATKAVEVLADRYQYDSSAITNKPFNGPVSPKVDRHGGVYFTDCNGHCQDSSAVYYLSADKVVKRVISTKSAWGITLAEDTLFLVDQNEIWAYPIIWPGEIDRHGKKIFSCCEDIWDLAMDAHGNLYLTRPTAKYIDVLTSSGQWLGKINFPDYTTTCTFGGPAMNILYVATGREFSPGSGALYAAQMRVAARPVQVTVTMISTNDLINPSNFELVQNYPNPFNAATTIEYNLPKPAHVIIDIYDLLGCHVRTLVNEFKMAGNFRAIWNGTNQENLPVCTDMYFCRMEFSDRTASSFSFSGQAGQGFLKVIKLALVR